MAVQSSSSRDRRSEIAVPDRLFHDVFQSISLARGPLTLGRAYRRPFLDLFLFKQKIVDLGLHCPDAFLLPFRHRLSVFDKALDQQVLKLHDPSSLLWG